MIAGHTRATTTFIPISHVLEYREFWEDVDNDRLDVEEDHSEYEGYLLSSLRYVKGERNYYRQLNIRREGACIDLVKEY